MRPRRNLHAERRGRSIECGVYPRKILSFHFANCAFWPFLGHSTVLRFLVVKIFITANGDQLRMSFIILQTSHFFVLQKMVKFKIFKARGDDPCGPSAEYATAYNKLCV